MKPAVVVELNQQALRHNIAFIKKIAPTSKVLSIVKANAYGHGLFNIAKSLSTCVDALGVARLQEALYLRHNNFQLPIVILDGVDEKEDYITCMQHHLTPVVHAKWQVEALIQSSLGQPIPIWLKINTGMNRLGIYPNYFKNAFDALTQSKNVVANFVIMTHFAHGDNPEHMNNSQQWTRFHELTKGLNHPLSMAACGLLLKPSFQGHWVRPGRMLYGVSPIKGQSAKSLGLKPVMTLKSRLIGIRQVSAGQTVGYSGPPPLSKDTLVGTIAIGYGDGYPATAQLGTPVLIRGHLCPLIASVSMDLTMVALPNATFKIGDEVTLWGDKLPVETLAYHANTTPLDLLCRLENRMVLNKTMKTNKIKDFQ